VRIEFRAAQASDCADLAALIDSASRGLLNWFWGTLCAPGQSAFEMGRSRIRYKIDSPSHYTRWTVGEIDGDLAGAFTGYRVADPYDPGDVSELPPVYQTMLELEAAAAGAWYLMAIAVYPEYRGRGLASAMLARAEMQAIKTNAPRIGMVVESANEEAYQLYRKFGYGELARRPYISFPGSPDSDEWILLMKHINP